MWESHYGANNLFVPVGNGSKDEESSACSINTLATNQMKGDRDV